MAQPTVGDGTPGLVHCGFISKQAELAAIRNKAVSSIPAWTVHPDSARVPALTSKTVNGAVEM